MATTARSAHSEAASPAKRRAGGATLLRAKPAPARKGPLPRRSGDSAHRVGPIIKWAGGKTRLLDELVARAPSGFRRYFEPFLGGAALFFRLSPEQAVLSDSNADLINMYRQVAWNTDGVLRRLAKHRAAHCDAHYYEVRERFNDTQVMPAEVDRAAAFIYLNKTCYNGLWRVNRRGCFNVPVGRYDSPSIFDRSLLEAASKVLRRAELKVSSYVDAVADAGEGDFVYFDPPYHPVSPTASFTSYTSESFSDDDQRALADLARRLVERGATVLLSNSDTPFIREIYSSGRRRTFRLDTVDCARAINSRASARGSIPELMILG